MRATTCDVAGPPTVQREGYTISSPVHSPSNAASLRCSSSGVGAARWSSAMGLAPLHGLDDLLRGIVKVICRQHIEAGFPDDFLAGIDIGALKPDHQRHLQADFFHRGDHALGDDVAFHDAAENVDQAPLPVPSAGDSLPPLNPPFP